jgi:oleate hydratase
MRGTTMTVDPKQAHLWIVGGGIAGMATAAFAIRDAGVPGENIHILEELQITGGAMDGTKSPVVPDGLVTRGGRMFEDEAYQTTWDLFSGIPSLEDPDVSVRQEILDFNSTIKTHANARLVDGQHRILDSTEYGLNARDRFEMTRVLGLSEKARRTPHRRDVRGALPADHLLADVADHVRLPEVALRR